MKVCFALTRKEWNEQVSTNTFQIINLLDNKHQVFPWHKMGEAWS